MSTTRDNIIDTTKELFSEKGYENVSLRDIASACNVSLGNLTYYFAKKEDLIVAVVGDIYGELSRMFAVITDGSLAELFDHFGALDVSSQKYYFCTRNQFALARDYPNIARYQERFREHLYYYYLRSFKEMVSGGSLRKEVPHEQYRNLAVRLILVALSQPLVSPTASGEVLRDMDFSQNLCDSVYPYLTEQGLSEWDAYFQPDDKDNG